MGEISKKVQESRFNLGIRVYREEKTNVQARE